MKHFVIAVCLLIFSACASVPEQGGGGNQSPPTTQPPIIAEPGQAPVRITEIGLKVGQCKKAAADLKWMSMPPYSGQIESCNDAIVGQPCSVEHVSCRSGGQVVLCHNFAPKTCYGWVYEKDIVTGISKPKKDVNVDLWSMPLCLVGACNSLVGPVKTNEFGYFELIGRNIPESTSVRAWTDGFYGVCGNDNKPSCINGRCSTGDTLVDSRKWEIRPIQLMKITETSCN